jgi:hypothetical protein
MMRVCEGSLGMDSYNSKKFWTGFTGLSGFFIFSYFHEESKETLSA